MLRQASRIEQVIEDNAWMSEERMLMYECWSVSCSQSPQSGTRALPLKHYQIHVNNAHVASGLETAIETVINASL